MLSILIPTYNYNTVSLVTELHKQCKSEAIVFEVIVFDDNSTDKSTIDLNEKINTFESCSFQVNAENLGRSKNRNALIANAKYDWLLLLDADTFPKNSNFIETYLKSIELGRRATFGGLAYQIEKPKNGEILRWEFGKKREAISLEERIKNPYETSLVSNILLKKNLLTEPPFNTEIIGYGFEDMVFINELKKNKIEISQIENPVFHLNLEQSIVFLHKYHSSLENLMYLVQHKIINVNDTRLTKWYNWLEKFKLVFIVSFLFKFSEKKLVKNLVSSKPSLHLFDFYKLGYFCTLIKK